MKVVKMLTYVVIGALIAFVLIKNAEGMQSLGEGKATYEAKCAMCHAKDGKGNPAMKGMAGGDMSKLDLTDAETAKLADSDLFTVTKAGRNKMPAYNGKLSDDQINSVVKYIRTLQGK